MSLLEEIDTPFVQEWVKKPTNVILEEIEARTFNIKTALYVYKDGHTVKRLKERAAQIESLLLIVGFRNLRPLENTVFKLLVTEAYVQINEAKST